MKYKKGSNGLYKASVYLGKKVDGKENRKYVYAKTQKELEEKLAQIKYMNIIPTDATLRDVTQKWYSLKQTKNSLKTQFENKKLIDNYIMKLGDYPLKLLKNYHIQEVVNQILSENHLVTAKKVAQLFKTIINFAIDNDFVGKNVAKNIVLPKIQSKEKIPLTKEEREIIENSTNKYRDFFMVLLYTGMRKGEITALTWNDVYHDHIVVDKSANFIHNQAVIKSTKNGKPRNIPLLDKIRPILERGGDGYVFTKTDGSPLSDSAIKRMLESFKKDTELNFTLHQLRHTFCTILYYSGISSKKAQEIMGHSSLDITLKIYTHLDNEQEGNIEHKLNNYLK